MKKTIAGELVKIFTVIFFQNIIDMTYFFGRILKIFYVFFFISINKIILNSESTNDLYF